MISTREVFTVGSAAHALRTHGGDVGRLARLERIDEASLRAELARLGVDAARYV